MCPTQVKGYSLDYSSLIGIVRLMLYYKKYIQNMQGLLLYLLIEKYVCWKQAGTCFLVY